MNCKLVQRRLLGVEAPDRPPADIEAHLTDCTPCREWQGRLVQMEKCVPSLPVPPTTAEADLLHLILTTPQPEKIEALNDESNLQDTASLNGRAATLPFQIPLRKDRPAWRGMKASRIVMAASAMAAALLLVVTFYALRDPNQSQLPVVKNRPTPDPLVRNLMQSNLGLAQAKTKEERVAKVGRVARDLREQADALAAAEQSEDLRKDFSTLVGRVNDWLKSAGQAVPVPLNSGSVQVADESRIRQLSANRKLIQVLVDGGLELAGQDDPVKRADSCLTIASSFALEIQDSAKAKDGDRAHEMGQHLYDLLSFGVVGNIDTARLNYGGGTAFQQEAGRINGQVAQMMGPLQQSLESATNADVRHVRETLTLIRKGRNAVEQAAKV